MPLRFVSVSKPVRYTPALDFDDADFKVELIPMPDDSKDSEVRCERVEKLVAKIIQLGLQDGRKKQRKEFLNETEEAA